LNKGGQNEILELKEMKMNEIIEFGDVGVVVVGATDGVFGTPHIFDSHLLLHK
jgi:hypothetical protein